MRLQRTAESLTCANKSCIADVDLAKRSVSLSL